MTKDIGFGLKLDGGKAQLCLLPPWFWANIDSKYSLQVANWYWGNERNLYCLDLFHMFDPMPALEFGAVKYDKHNWAKGLVFDRVVSAFHRHCNYKNKHGVWVRRDLHNLDPESNLPHGCHAACNFLFLSHYNCNLNLYKSFDNRPMFLSKEF